MKQQASEEKIHNLKQIISLECQKQRLHPENQLRVSRSLSEFKQKYSKKRNSYKKNRDHDEWTASQIRQLFTYYDVNGPVWKDMTTVLSQRSANTIKNKFYTVLRNLLKILFRKNDGKCPKVTGEVSSKILSRLYDGKQNYFQYQGLLRQALQAINYDLENERVDNFVQEKAQIILKVYQEIYTGRLQTDRPEISQQIKKEDRSQPNFPPSITHQLQNHQHHAAQRANYIEKMNGPQINSSSNQISFAQGLNYYFMPYLNPYWPLNYFW